jgi:hypothetical protein
MFTSLTGASKPHHIVDGAGVVLGYSHFGMLAAARWLLQQTTAELAAALRDSPGYALRIVGHSLGGGTAALLTMMCALTSPRWPPVSRPACYTSAPPVHLSCSVPAGLKGNLATCMQHKRHFSLPALPCDALTGKASS